MSYFYLDVLLPNGCCLSFRFLRLPFEEKPTLFELGDLTPAGAYDIFS